MTVNETKDFNGVTPKVGDIIAVIVPTSTRAGTLKKARVTSFKECQRMVKMFIEPLANVFLYRDYICLTRNNNNQFIIINGEGTTTDL
jgi:hypothetical protein